MLTRIEIDGFKTFEDFHIDLAPFAVVLGTNASGKSNLFDAVQLLANLATQDVSEALKAMRGEPLEMFRRTPAGTAQQMRFAVEVLVDPTARDPWGSQVTLRHTRLRYEVCLERREIRPGVERVLVVSESAKPILRKDDRWLKFARPSIDFRGKYLKYSRQADLLVTEGENSSRAFRIHQDGKQGRTRPASAAEATVLYSITNAEFPHLFALREEMRGWRLLQLDPALLRRPAPVTAPDILQPDGANLAAVLARLKAETASVSRPWGVLPDIAAELNALVPGVRSLNVEMDERTREYRVELTMRDGVPFSSRVVSDGTLRVLALLTLLHDPRHRGVVCFEEPENGVHPARLKQLIQSLRGMVSNPRAPAASDDAPLTQLLLNSHSPVVLSALLSAAESQAAESIFFADSVGVADPASHQQRRKTRLRRVIQKGQGELPTDDDDSAAAVSSYEVGRVLDTASAGA